MFLMRMIRKRDISIPWCWDVRDVTRTGGNSTALNLTTCRPKVSVLSFGFLFLLCYVSPLKRLCKLVVRIMSTYLLKL